MKNKPSSNRGATLIELITSIAILSIVGLSCFTLLMFSIRTNNFILTGTNACRDAEVLNNRLEHLLFDEIDITIDSDDNILIEYKDDETTEIVWHKDESTLMQGELLLQDQISEFVVEPLYGTRLVRITYTIDDSYKSCKVFATASVFEEPPS